MLFPRKEERATTDESGKRKKMSKEKGEKVIDVLLVSDLRTAVEVEGWKGDVTRD